MKPGGKKFRKRPRQVPRDKASLSASLRQIGERIKKRDFASGLAKADQLLAAPGMTEHARARVLALVADSEFKRGRFAEAAQIQLQAASKSIDHATLWLRPHIGHVRALLKVPQVEQAVMIARHAVAVAEAKMTDFDVQVSAANRDLAENGAVAFTPLPPRVSVVATRMGYLFMAEGEPEVAEEFFSKAIESTKGGANRARQGLARVALAKGEFGKAHRLAADAILRGGFKAKTRSAWITLIAARRQLPGWRISDRLIKGLDAAPAGLRAKTILTIVRELRKSNMRQWREVAERWSSREGAQFPIVEAEMKKLMLASAKAEPGNAAGKREIAEQLLLTPGLTPNEWISAAKEWVRASLWEGRAVDVEQLISTAVAAHGQGVAPYVRHSLALSCMMAKRHDMARPLLRANIQEGAREKPQWGKSIWALARMEGLLGDHATAARLYRRFADEDSIAAKFRLQAQLLWCKELIAAGQPGPLLEARSLMAATLGNVQDPDLLMNFARQLQFAPAELREWGQQLFEQGKAMALQRFDAASSPSEAISILFKLTRRQVRDFGRHEEVVAFWAALTQEKRDWLWSESRDFWEYLGQVFEAYARAGDLQKAEAFAGDFLDDPATPAEGRPFLGIPLARRLMQADRAADGLELFEQMASADPTHPLCAEAWYWMALVAYKRGETGKINEYAGRIRAAQGSHIGMLVQWNYDARALLLLANLNPASVDPQAVNYAPYFLQGQLLAINGDLGRIPL